jgi:hypothetical protein
VRAGGRGAFAFELGFLLGGSIWWWHQTALGTLRSTFTKEVAGQVLRVTWSRGQMMCEMELGLLEVRETPGKRLGPPRRDRGPAGYGAPWICIW